MAVSSHYGSQITARSAQSHTSRPCTENVRSAMTHENAVMTGDGDAPHHPVLRGDFPIPYVVEEATCLRSWTRRKLIGGEYSYWPGGRQGLFGVLRGHVGSGAALSAAPAPVPLSVRVPRTRALLAWPRKIAGARLTSANPMLASTGA